MFRMTKEKTAGTEDQHELVGINSTVPLKVEHSEDLSDTAGGTTAPARSAADVRIPLKVQPPRSNGWKKEAGVQYLVALDVDGTLVDHDGRQVSLSDFRGRRVLLFTDTRGAGYGGRQGQARAHRHHRSGR